VELWAALAPSDKPLRMHCLKKPFFSLLLPSLTEPPESHIIASPTLALLTLFSGAQYERGPKKDLYDLLHRFL
jgi:hypothetical protein